MAHRVADPAGISGNFTPPFLRGYFHDDYFPVGPALGALILSSCFAFAAAIVLVSYVGCDTGNKQPAAPTPPPVRTPKPISVDFVPKEALFRRW